MACLNVWLITPLHGLLFLVIEMPICGLLSCTIITIASGSLAPFNGSNYKLWLACNMCWLKQIRMACFALLCFAFSYGCDFVVWLAC